MMSAAAVAAGVGVAAAKAFASAGTSASTEPFAASKAPATAEILGSMKFRGLGGARFAEVAESPASESSAVEVLVLVPATKEMKASGPLLLAGREVSAGETSASEASMVENRSRGARGEFAPVEAGVRAAKGLPESVRA